MRKLLMVLAILLVLPSLCLAAMLKLNNNALTVMANGGLQDYPHTIYISSYTFVDDDTVTVGDGSYWICNGSLSKLTSATNVDISSPTGPDFYYLYDDDSERSGTTPTLVFSTTEPSFTEATGKIGWYNGDERCIAVAWVEAGNTIDDFVATIVGGSCIRYTFDTAITLASNMNPDGTWQTPDDDAGATYIPIGASQAHIGVSNADAGSVIVSAKSAESNTNGTTDAIYYEGYSGANIIGWLNLGSSRNMVVFGDNDDNNALSLKLYGWEFRP